MEWPPQNAAAFAFKKPCCDCVKSCPPLRLPLGPNLSTHLYQTSIGEPIEVYATENDARTALEDGTVVGGFALVIPRSDDPDIPGDDSTTITSASASVDTEEQSIDFSVAGRSVYFAAYTFTLVGIQIEAGDLSFAAEISHVVTGTDPDPPSGDLPRSFLEIWIWDGCGARSSIYNDRIAQTYYGLIQSATGTLTLSDMPAGRYVIGFINTIMWGSESVPPSSVLWTGTLTHSAALKVIPVVAVYDDPEIVGVQRYIDHDYRGGTLSCDCDPEATYDDCYTEAYNIAYASAYAAANPGYNPPFSDGAYDDGYASGYADGLACAASNPPAEPTLATCTDAYSGPSGTCQAGTDDGTTDGDCYGTADGDFDRDTSARAGYLAGYDVGFAEAECP